MRTDLSQVGELIDLRGAPVVDRDGTTIGTVEQIWVDRVNELPEWAAVKPSRARKTRLVPLRAADLSPERVTVNYTAADVKGAPDIDPRESGREDMERLYRHYRQPLPAPPPPAVRNPFDRLTATWVPGVAEKAAEAARRGEALRNPRRSG